MEDDPDRKFGQDDRSEFYRTHHGLHVIENVFVEGCSVCDERAVILTMARMTGIDPEKAVSDATIARELTNKLGGG
jgi:hypothetical protein